MNRVLVLLLSLGCNRQAEPSAALEPERACKSACAAFTRQTCSAPEPREDRHAECVSTCMTASRVATLAGCWAQHRSYLDCVSRRSSACPPSSVAAGIALENASGISECAREHAAYFRCTEPCREQGVLRTRSLRLTHGGRERAVQAELVHAGCGRERPKPVKKSDPGAPCTHHSVCSASTCSCKNREVGYLARACVDGHCAEPTLACAVAPKAVSYDPCR